MIPYSSPNSVIYILYPRGKLLENHTLQFTAAHAYIYKMSASPQQQTNEWCRISRL